MNRLIVGRDKSPILEHLPSTFLLIDDGDLLDALKLPTKRKEKSFLPHVTRFDVTKHSFNPLAGIDYPKAEHFVSVINAVFPAGENTLTREACSVALMEWLLTCPKDLTRFPRAKSKDDVGLTSASLKMRRLLLSPVLNRVLTSRTNFPPDGIILARLNRAELGDFDCFVLANLLVSHYTGQVVIPDLGFYGCPFHTKLIYQNRLIAGVNFLDETPLRNQLLLIEDKIPSRCLPEDAETLAQFVGLTPRTNKYNDFIEASIE